jgi:transposase-like protein
MYGFKKIKCLYKSEELEEGVTEGKALGSFLRKGMEIIIQELLEAEVTEFLKRGHYERNKGGVHRGYRNGYEARKVRTAEGEVVIELPQVRNTQEPYRSKVKEFFRGNTECLERLTAEMYARGLSTRDSEDALMELTGDVVLSKSSISKVTDILWEE